MPRPIPWLRCIVLATGSLLVVAARPACPPQSASPRAARAFHRSSVAAPRRRQGLVTSASARASRCRASPPVVRAGPSPPSRRSTGRAAGRPLRHLL